MPNSIFTFATIVAIDLSNLSDFYALKASKFKKKFLR